MSRVRLVLVFAIASAGCPSIDNDGNEVTTAPTVQFDPSSSIVPFPNNLVRDPATGRVNLPEQCNESAAQTALRTGTLNQLNGFGTFKAAMSFTLSEALDADTDAATLHANIKLFKRATGMTPVDPASATEVPILIQPSTTFRYDNGCTMPPVEVSSVVIVPFITDDTTGAPLAPITLEENSTYDVMIGTGLHADDGAAGTTNGAAFEASFTWEFVRQAEDPVTLNAQGQIIAERTPLDPADPVDAETLRGVDLLWKAHKAALDFVTAAAQVTREDITLAWEFTTQTTTAQLDPTAAGSPANAITGSHFLVGSITGAQTPAEYLSAPNRLGPQGCGLVGCADIGAILGGTTDAPQYQQLLPNPGGFADIPGQWSDPIAPTEVQVEPLEVAVFVPQGSPPANGWPTIIYGHGLGSSKTSLAILAPQLARAGFVTIGIDFVAHGSRAKRISDDAAIGCAGTPDPTVSPQCFQAIFSANLGQTRDNIRQTVLDLQQLIASVKTCTTANPCGALAVDPDNMGYIGISLGGIIGSMTVAEAQGLEAGVTNVAGGGLIDVIENTQTLAIKCTLVNALIDAGVVVGDKWNPAVDPTVGICLTEDWKTQPGYRQFAVIARWVLDPSDPANFAAKLATRTSLLQEVMGDKVVPNIATDQLGVLSARTPATADAATVFAPPATMPPPSAAVNNVTTSLWVRYPSLPADPGVGFPGNAFHHASLLRPNEDGAMAPTNAELLGWARIRTDATEYLITNVLDN